MCNNYKKALETLDRLGIKPPEEIKIPMDGLGADIHEVDEKLNKILLILEERSVIRYKLLSKIFSVNTLHALYVVTLIYLFLTTRDSSWLKGIEPVAIK